MIFLKAIYHPYNLMNLMPSITSVVIWILLSLNTLISCISFPFLFEIKLDKGILRITNTIPNTPGQPNLVMSNMVEPIAVTGKVKELINVANLISMMPRSLARRLVIFPISVDFII